MIGILLGLQFINSDTYQSLDDNVRAMFAPGDGPVESGVERAPAKTEQPVQTAPGEPAVDIPVETTETFLCNRGEAEKIRDKARSIAEITETRDGALHVRMRKQWAYYTPGIRQSFLQAFAESDTCLLGHSRIIHFYYNGEEIAVSRPARGLKLEQ